MLLVAGLMGALPMLYFRVKEHTILEEETLARLDDERQRLSSTSGSCQELRWESRLLLCHPKMKCKL